MKRLLLFVIALALMSTTALAQGGTIGGGGGGGSVTYPLLGTNGTAAAPTFSFSNATSAGLFFVGSDTLGFASGGQAPLKVLTAGVNSRWIGRGGLIIHSGNSAITVDGGGTGLGTSGWSFSSNAFIPQGARSHDIGTASVGVAVVYTDTISSGNVDSLKLVANNVVFALGVHDTLVIANKAKASSLTAASGTPNSICIDATSKQITENAATSCVVSSRRFKENIAPLTYESALGIVSRLGPSTFTYREGKRRALGLIAEDVVRVDPRLVTYDGKGQINSVNYEQVTIALLAVVQQQQQDINQLHTVLLGLLGAGGVAGAGLAGWRKRKVT